MAKQKLKVWEAPKVISTSARPASIGTVSEIAHRNNYSESHMRKLLAKGVIEGVKVDNMWLVKEDAVKAHRRKGR